MKMNNLSPVNFTSKFIIPETNRGALSTLSNEEMRSIQAFGEIIAKDGNDDITVQLDMFKKHNDPRMDVITLTAKDDAGNNLESNFTYRNFLHDKTDSIPTLPGLATPQNLLDCYDELFRRLGARGSQLADKATTLINQFAPEKK